MKIVLSITACRSFWEISIPPEHDFGVRFPPALKKAAPILNFMGFLIEDDYYSDGIFIYGEIHYINHLKWITRAWVKEEESQINLNDDFIPF